MDRTVALDALKVGLESGTVSDKDRGFVESLVAQSATRGLSDKQWYWVAKLASKLVGDPQPATVANFERVYVMFQKAKEHLKYPKFNLATPSGRGVKLYLSGERSRVPDTVNVVDTCNDGWYGRVYQDGKWEQGTASSGMDEVEALLNRLASDPEGVAAEHGKLTGNCCFCSRGLSDERSTEVGYGPVCASRYGLTWGKK